MKHLIVDNAKRRGLFNQREADNVSQKKLFEPYLLSEDEHNESDADIDTNDEDDMDL